MRVFPFSCCLFIVTSASAVSLSPSDVFLGQPMSVTVKEHETAEFICSVKNISFEIIWFVNGTDAGMTIFDESGIDFRYAINFTLSWLTVEGRLSSNNTRVHCAATQDVPLTWTDSQVALLTIQGEAASDPTDRNDSLSPTQTTDLLSQAPRPSQPYKVDTTRYLKSTSIKSSSPKLTVQPPTILTQRNPTENSTVLIVLLVTIVSVIVTLSVVMVFTLLILVISKNKRKVSDSKDVDDIRLDPNPVYEVKKPIRTQKSELYELSKPIEC